MFPSRIFVKQLLGKNKDKKLKGLNGEREKREIKMRRGKLPWLVVLVHQHMLHP
jgi:hypothetical protein